MKESEADGWEQAQKDKEGNKRAMSEWKGGEGGQLSAERWLVRWREGRGKKLCHAADGIHRIPDIPLGVEYL